MRYLRNAWYVAAWAQEIQAGTLFHRKLLDESVLLFRDSNNVAHALANRCPHRFAPLHLGKLKGDSVQCGYHGLEFNAEGQCVFNPHSERVPPTARVKSYPCIERHGAIWLWMGDVAKADALLIPDFGCLDEEHHHVARRYLHVKANYVLEADNILDLSHIEFLHPGSLGSEAVKRAATQVVQEGNRVWSKRLTNAEVLPHFVAQSLNIPDDQRVDRWLDVRWDAPANMLLIVGATPTGRPREEGRQSPIAHLFTPESSRTTHYWFARSIGKSMPDGAAWVERNIDGLLQPFMQEDLPMLEAQQQMIGDADFWSLKPALFSVDAGAARARRVLDKLIAAEQSIDVC